MKRHNTEELVVFHELDQDSEEWLMWRNKGIGSSDVALLMHPEPLFDRTVGTLWKTRVGYERPVAINNEHVKRGKELEPIIRDMVNEMLGTNYEPICISRKDAPYLRASLDGFDARTDTLLEIKAPSDKVFQKYLDSWEIPQNYYEQMQYQMLVSNVEYGVFAFYNAQYDHPFIMHVENNHHLQLEIEKRCALFWRGVETKTPVGWDGDRFEMFRCRPTAFVMVVDKGIEESILKLGKSLPIRVLWGPDKLDSSFVFPVRPEHSFRIITMKEQNPLHHVKIINLTPSPFGNGCEDCDFDSAEGFMRSLSTWC